jgi:hypothetical protein
VTEGEECIRLLSTDKEGSAVCVVQGETEMTCFPLYDLEDDSFAVHRITLPTGVSRIILQDDSSSVWSNTPAFCALTESGDLHCADQGQPLLKREDVTNCSDVAVTDGNAVCAICDGQLTCPELFEEENGSSIDAADAQFYSLREDGIHHGGYNKLTVPGQFQSFTLDQEAAICTIDTAGEARCSAYPYEEHVMLKGIFSSITTGNYPNVCALKPGGGAECWNLEIDELIPVPAELWTDISSTSGGSCGLSIDGRVRCWDHNGLPIVVFAAR